MSTTDHHHPTPARRLKGMGRPSKAARLIFHGHAGQGGHGDRGGPPRQQSEQEA